VHRTDAHAISRAQDIRAHAAIGVDAVDA